MRSDPTLINLSEDLGALINTHRDTPLSVPSEEEYINPQTNPVVLLYKGRPLVTTITKSLRYTLYSPAIIATICKQEQLTERQFDQIDWLAHKQAFQHSWSCKWIIYTKLAHKLLNTQVQNKKFYGNSDICHCCKSGSETLLHAFTCPSVEVTSFRQKQQIILWTALDNFPTPEPIIHQIRTGILQFEPLQSGALQVDNAEISAYAHQTSLGWEAFLRGRISAYWRLEYQRLTDTDTKTSLKWASYLVLNILQYSHALWTFRCGVLHGHTQDENTKKHREDLLEQIRLAFEEYEVDPFHVPSDWRRLFFRPFHLFLSSDRDTLQCWLRSYSKAKQQQTLITQRVQKQAERFLISSSTSKTSPLNSSLDDSSEIDAESNSDDSDDDESILNFIPFPSIAGREQDSSFVLPVIPDA
jgi:hypothetical protein